MLKKPPVYPEAYPQADCILDTAVSEPRVDTQGDAIDRYAEARLWITSELAVWE